MYNVLNTDSEVEDFDSDGSEITDDPTPWESEVGFVDEDDYISDIPNNIIW